MTYQVTSGNLVGTDSLSGTLSRVAGEDVGSYAINQNTLTAGSNYDLTYAGDNFAIEARPITVTADALQSKTYGDSDPALTYQVTSGNLVGTDSLSGTLSRVAGEDVGSYAINQNTLTAGSNYDLTYAGDNFAIEARPITVTADALQSKTYGDSDPALTYQVTSGNLVGTDSLSGTLSRVAGEDVGSYAINQNTLTAGSNYDLTYAGDNFAIEARQITVTADALNKTYGDSDPALTYQVTSGNLVGTDSLSGTLSRVAGEDVGSYAINQNTLTAGSNYDLTYVGANLTVSTKTLIVTANNTTMVLGGPVPTFSAYYIGLVNGDTVSSLGNLSSLTFTPVNTTSQGSSAITLTGSLTSSDYTIVYDPGTLTVNTPTKPIIIGLPLSKKLS